MTNPSTLVGKAFLNRDLLKQEEYAQAVHQAIAMIDNGEARVASNEAGEWEVNEWVKQAVLLYFSLTDMEEISVGPFMFHDKIPLKQNYRELGVRVVPPSIARYGTFMERGVVLMGSYVNIGAFIGANTMIDSWALVGSCAQVGANVHVSAGVVIGGVLEPASARPVIIEDGAFIGSGCKLVEGVIVEEEAVLGANVTLTASVPIIDVTKSEPVEYRGRVPARSVVVPGTVEKKFPGGTYSVSCALIIGERKESTDKKTSLNEVLREFAEQL